MAMRARAGVQVGDVQKEAHMAFYLGVLSEKQDQYQNAVKFFKRFFFCARMLDDPVGASLALNRVGVAYYKSSRIEKSLRFHLKHCEFSDKENAFAAYYNIGMCYKLTGDLEQSELYFSRALEWAQHREDFSSECITHG
jgi:tetratricopeptide (TPR) repeat protein